VKYLFVVGIALILARGVSHLIAPTALDAPVPPPPPRPSLTIAAEGPAGTISGHLHDAASGEPLAGAAVVVEGTARGASTDVHGEYAIAGIAPGLYKLEAVYVGYRSLRTAISLDSLTGVRIDFRLVPTPIRLRPVD